MCSRDERDQLRTAGRFLLVAADDVDHIVREQLAELIERGQLAAVLVTGVDGQHALARQRRLQQQVPQIASEHFDGVRLGFFGQLAAGFALQAGQDQPRERVAHAARQKILVRMIGRHELLDAELLDRRRHRLRPCTRSILARSPRLIASTRCGGMRLQRLAEIEVIVELLVLLRVVFDLRARELARLAIQLADFLAQFGVLAELLGQDVAGAQAAPSRRRGCPCRC